MISQHDDMEYYLENIPYKHPKVSINDINENGKWLTKDAIRTLKKKLKNCPDGRYSKKELSSKYGIKNPKFPVIKTNGQYYLIYKGKKQSLGEGGFGAVKLSQNVDSDKTCVIKILKTKKERKLGNVLRAGERERKNLESVSQLITAYQREGKNNTKS